MKNILDSESFDFLSDQDKVFIISFDKVMKQLGYDCGDAFEPGHCWGKYMLIYRKQNVKSKKVYARIYIRDNGIVLRMYFSNIDKHRRFIEESPDFIKEVFIGTHGQCTHCHNEKDGKCKFRKSYTIHDQYIEKCNGIIFEFWNPNEEKIEDYINLFTEFYPSKKLGRRTL